MQSNALNPTAAELDLTGHDLSPLAWVLDELRKSLDSATKSLKRFVRDADVARGSDLAAIDASQLRIARQQLHQAVGALEMVGLSSPALVLRAMEAAVQKFIQQPEQCNQDAAAKIERASFALTEYLEGLLADKPISAVSLFPQYREVQELLRADRIHPADLWAYEWHWREPETAFRANLQEYGANVRAVFDQSTLQIMKGETALAARKLCDLSLGLSAAQTDRQPRIFWVVAAAYFEALAYDLIAADIYVRRAASRILLQYASLSKGSTEISKRLALDLLFFCAQAGSRAAADTPVLAAVCLTYGLGPFKPVDYEAVQFGRFDPARLAQARKRIVSAKENWSALSAGEVSKCKLVLDQFSLVTDSLVKLHPPSEPLAQALMRAAEGTALLGQSPSIELAMEVATSVLYLEAAFDDLDPRDPQLAARTLHLAERLERVRNGGQSQPLESWMKDLYRRVSDKQTMGSVVGELRISLGNLEKSLDLFFRDPQNKTVLRDVPGQLSQMRGVLSVLGLDQASHTVLRMRDRVEQMLATEEGDEHVQSAAVFEQLGNNLGALSFLIDMLNYQPVLAKKLFVYDAEKGELKPLMGLTSRSPEWAADANPDPIPNTPALAQDIYAAVQTDDAVVADEKLPVKLDALKDGAGLAGRGKTSQGASLALSAENLEASASAMTGLDFPMLPALALPDIPVNPVDFEEEDLRGIFLDEAREVIANGLQANASLANTPGDMAHMAVLRRGFHTLKGSSRMVGLNEFGEAAWSMEQLFNSWLADQKTASTELRSLTIAALTGFSTWIENIAVSTDQAWTSSSFRRTADAMRTQERFVPLLLPEFLPQPSHQTPVAALQAPDSAAMDVSAVSSSDEAVKTSFDHSFDMAAIFGIEPSRTPAEIEASQPDLPAQEPHEIDFESLSALTGQDDATFVPQNLSESVSLELQEFFVSTDPDFEESGTVDMVELSAADFDQHFLTQDCALSSEEKPSGQSASEGVSGAFAGTLAPTPAVISRLDFEIPADTEFEAIFAGNTSLEEQVKVIGGLRIGIPLYNVFLNEADEWSRRLVTELSEWAIERHHPIGDSTVALAHSLAGSSATVGFDALSDIARALEHAFQQSQVHHSEGAAEIYADLFVDAAEDIRRLLHQFAAGFLKEPDTDVLHRLRHLEFREPISLLPVPEPDDEKLVFKKEVADPAAVNTQSLAAIATPTMPVADQVTLGSEFQVVSASPVTATDPHDAIPVRSFTTTSSAAFLGEYLEDDGIDAVDAIDLELFPIFEEEGAELMPRLSAALRQWSARPDNQGARMEVLRSLHTLKGSARLAGALRLGEMAHRVESEIEYLGSGTVAAQEFEPLMARVDAMQLTLEALRKADASFATSVSPPFLRSVPNPVQVSAEPELAVAQEPEALAFDAESSLLELPAPATVQSAGKVLVPAPQAMIMQPLRQAATASIRVRSQLLDRMLDQAGEVMITRSRLEAELNQLRGSLGDMSASLSRLRQQLRDIELQAETQMQSRLALTSEAQAVFDPLEFDRFTRVQELTRMMAESVNDVATVQRTLQRTVEATEDDLVAQARQTRELPRDLLRTRMVEFEGISERLYRVVRQASKETGKQVRLDLLGGTIEMDRAMLDRMTPAFEHLLRNCVVHGIESPQLRAQAGKTPIGLITVHLRQQGNDVSVDFSDDGDGLDLIGIREKAISLGLLTADQPMDDQAAADLIFMPGFSTVAKVTELAGRGIGMDVVRSEVNGVGGRIVTTTVKGRGTRFQLVLPLTTAVTQVVMVRSGALLVGVPASVVETVRRVSAKELQQAYNAGVLDVAGEAVPFFWSGALLQASSHSTETHAKTTAVVVFRSAAQRIALHLDEVLGTQEVVVKNLGPQLARLPGLAGMSVLPSGAVVLIYNPVALASIHGDQARALSADRAASPVLETSGSDTPWDTAATPVVSEIPLILVVDDSITVRRVTQRLLQREGYRVAMAADGLQALERLQEEVPAVVLSDIEMPHMDGFDLARNIRADARLHNLPIIMITSRLAEKHREHARDLGVNHYLGKPYPEEELMTLVRRYCGAAVAV